METRETHGTYNIKRPGHAESGQESCVYIQAYYFSLCLACFGLTMILNGKTANVIQGMYYL